MTQIPFSYLIIPGCALSNVSPTSDNLGEILSGEVSYITDYKVKIKDSITYNNIQVNMNVDGFCFSLCKPIYYKEDQVKLLKWLIENKYTTTW